MNKLLSVSILEEFDSISDGAAYLGKYTDDPDPWAIVVAEGDYLANLGEDYELPGYGRSYRFFLPYAGGEEPGTELYQKYGKEDYARMRALGEDWYYIQIAARARIGLPNDRGSISITVETPGLWGIESDSPADHKLEVAEEELSTLKTMLGQLNTDLSGWTTFCSEALNNYKKLLR